MKAPVTLTHIHPSLHRTVVECARGCEWLDGGWVRPCDWHEAMILGAWRATTWVADG